MKYKNNKSEHPDENRIDDPILTPGIGSRIEIVSNMLGSKAAAGRAAFKSDIQIGRYIRGQSVPTVDVIVGLARAAGVSLEWLATGAGPMRSEGAYMAPLNNGILRDVLEVLEEVIAERKLNLSPAKKAELISLIYEEILEQEQQGKEINRDKVIRLISLAS